MTTNRTIRVLIAKPVLDGRDRGVKILTLGLREGDGGSLYWSVYESRGNSAESTQGKGGRNRFELAFRSP